jgi:hypothetical protein
MSPIITLIALANLLGILLICLKLGAAITWPWLWVLSPLFVENMALIAVVFLTAR